MWLPKRYMNGLLLILCRITRKLNLYDNHHIAAVATFGKKISEAQIYKLQSKGVRTVVIGYDGDAVSAINTAAKTKTMVKKVKKPKQALIAFKEPLFFKSTKFFSIKIAKAGYTGIM